jgi:hypothetical protein
MLENENIIKCPYCGAENNVAFVMYYKDLCWKCDRDCLPWREEMFKELYGDDYLEAYK